MRKLTALSIDLWLKPGVQWNPEAQLVTKGQKLWLGFEAGRCARPAG